MKLIQCFAHNFGSYKHIEFCFEDLGLALLYGKTGSGKSTIQDLIPWCLFGVTAKDGNADEVRSWSTPKETTIAQVEVEVNGKCITIRRERGPNAKTDLYYFESNSPETLVRGKDIPDTQRLLENRLNVSSDTYLAAAYFHEFSETGSFFTAKAKDRRSVFERIADLSLSTKLGEASAASRKTTRQSLEAENRTFEGCEVTIRQLSANIENAESKLASFEADLVKEIKVLKDKSLVWAAGIVTEANKCSNAISAIKLDPDAEAQVAHLKEKLASVKDHTCDKCGSKTKSNERQELKDALNAAERGMLSNIQARKDIVRFTDKIKELSEAQSPYDSQLEALKDKPNPFEALLDEYRASLESAEEKLLQTAGKVDALEERLAGLNRLYDLSSDLRAELLKRSVQEIQAETNRYLEAYFDAEIRVQFSVDSDNLEVGIQKSGNECVYTQLSKGQRQLLKLCFVSSIMQATANRAGAHFSHIFMDEALDGTDSTLKLKAYRLLQDLSKGHEGVLVIDHDEGLRTLFDKKFKVEMVNGYSELSEDE